MMKAASIILILAHFLTAGVSHSFKDDNVRIRRQSPQPPYLLLYSYQDDVTILRLNLDGTGYYLVKEQSLNVSSPPTPQLSSIDYSYSSNNVYFSLGTGIGVASLYAENQEASSISVIGLNGLESIGDLSFDWINDRLYFIGTGSGVEGVYAYDISNGIITQLTQFTAVTGESKICTAANHSLIFWNEDNVVMFGSPDTMDFFTFETVDSGLNILDLFCDSSVQYLNVYLSDGTILQFNYLSTLDRLVETISDLVDTGPLVTQAMFPTDAARVSVFNGELFFLVSFSNDIENGTYVLHSIPVRGDILSYPTVFFTDTFVLVQPNLQPGVPDFARPCLDEPCCSSSEDCSELCLQVTVDSYVCSCRQGYTLSSLTECSLSPATASFIYSYLEDAGNGAMVGVVRRRNIDGGSSGDSLVAAQYMGTQTGKIQQLAISVSNGELYFLETNELDNILSRVSLSDKTNKSTIINLGSSLVVVLSFDWLNDYLYWTNSTSILRMRPDDGQYEIFVATDLYSLALALDPLEDLICYSVWNNTLSSSDIICVNSTLYEVFRVSVGYLVPSLALDLLENRIYWRGNGQAFFTTCSVYNSSDCFQIPYPSYQGSTSDDNIISSIYIAEDRLVWLPLGSRSIVHMDKITGEDVVPFTVTSPTNSIISVNALDVDVFYYQPGFGYLSCLRDNGGCSHFCFPSSDGATFSCGCPPGYYFADNTTCEFFIPETTAPPTASVTAPPCPENQCFGHGTCTSSVVLGFQCTCTFPFVGERCQNIDSSLLSQTGGDDSTDVNIKPSVLIPTILIPLVVVFIILAAVVSVVSVVLLVLLRRQNSKNSIVEKKDGVQSYENTHLEKTPSRIELL